MISEPCSTFLDSLQVIVTDVQLTLLVMVVCYFFRYEDIGGFKLLNL